MRVAFFGLPLAGLLLARDGHDVVYAGICRRGAIGTRRLARRLASERREVEVKPDASARATIERVRAARPDIVVSWFWTTKLARELRECAPLGAVGVHPSLLPRHRGPDPYFWTIDAGDAETGVTAHVLEDEYDTGAILARRALRVDPRWNAWQLARALDRPSVALLRDVVARRTSLRGEMQDESAATAAPEPSDEELAIRWSWPAERIERRVRAAAPWPGAWTEIGDAIVTLVRVAVTRDFPRALCPGEAAVRGDGVAVVRAGDLAVELLEGREEREHVDTPLSTASLSAVVAAART